MEAIFINYRRADSAAGYSRSLAQALRKEFGDDFVFRDIKGIPPGENFPDVIESKLASCRVMLVLIGIQWSRLTDSNGRRRLDNPQDWVRKEIVTALERDILVIPVLIGGAPMPIADDLPNDIAELSSRNAFTMSDDDWDHDLSQLIQALRTHLGVSTLVPTERSGKEALLDVLAKAIRKIPQGAQQPKRPALMSSMLGGLFRWIRSLAVVAIIVWIAYTQSTEFAAGVDRFFSRSADMLLRLLA